MDLFLLTTHSRVQLVYSIGLPFLARIFPVFMQLLRLLSNLYSESDLYSASKSTLTVAITFWLLSCRGFGRDKIGEFNFSGRFLFRLPTITRTTMLEAPLKRNLVYFSTLSGCVDSQWTIDSFARNPERFIQKMDTAVNLCRERREQFILLEVLPHLEESWGKCSELNEGIYKQLAKLSHCVSSGQVVRHSLQLLLHLICRDNFEKGHGSLLDLEKIIRLSIFTPQGVFRKDKQSEGTIELLVYSGILLLLLRSVVLQGELLAVDLENDCETVVEELRRHQKQIRNRRDNLRYSVDLICALLSNFFLIESREISPKAKRMKNFLEESQEFCGNPYRKSKDLKILPTLREKNKTLEWDELHLILYHLLGKVCNLTNYFFLN